MSDCTPVGPELPVARWVDTRDTLQLMTQVVGKVRLANTPLSNHWWNVVLYASACGLTTGLIPPATKSFHERCVPAGPAGCGDRGLLGRGLRRRHADARNQRRPRLARAGDTIGAVYVSQGFRWHIAAVNPAAIALLIELVFVLGTAGDHVPLELLLALLLFPLLRRLENPEAKPGEDAQDNQND